MLANYGSSFVAQKNLYLIFVTIAGIKIGISLPPNIYYQKSSLRSHNSEILNHTHFLPHPSQSQSRTRDYNHKKTHHNHKPQTTPQTTVLLKIF